MKDLNKYINLRDLVKDYGGIENFRFFGHLSKYDMITPFGFALTSPCNEWVECKIEDDNSSSDLYTLAGGYKVKVVPVNDERFASDRFYQCDLLSSFKGGYFIIKTDDDEHVEEKEGIEHLCGAAYIHHTWSEVVKGNK